MRLEDSVRVQVPRPVAWTYLAEPDNYLRFMHGVIRWDVEGERRTGLGARYAMRMRVGTAYVGGLVEIVEFNGPRELAWTSVTGIDQRGRWRLRSPENGVTDVTLRLSFTVPGGLLSRLTERIAGRMVATNVRESLRHLKDQLEDGAAASGDA